jgi:hypothetical protein
MEPGTKKSGKKSDSYWGAVADSSEIFSPILTANRDVKVTIQQFESDELKAKN